MFSSPVIKSFIKNMILQQIQVILTDSLPAVIFSYRGKDNAHISPWVYIFSWEEVLSQILDAFSKYLSTEWKICSVESKIGLQSLVCISYCCHWIPNLLTCIFVHFNCEFWLYRRWDIEKYVWRILSWKSNMAAPSDLGNMKHFMNVF